MKQACILFILLIFFCASYSQDNKKVFSFGKELNRAKSQEEIIFFGYDMSNLKCTVKERDLSDFALCTRIPGEIINWLHGQYGTTKIRKELGVRKLTFENAAIQLRTKNLEQNCLTTEMHTISELQLKGIIKSYEIPENIIVRLVLLE